MPGHTLMLDDSGEIGISSYWDLEVNSGKREDARILRARIPRTPGRERPSHLMSDVPLGVFLSGGLDSSAVAALTAKSSQRANPDLRSGLRRGRVQRTSIRSNSGRSILDRNITRCGSPAKIFPESAAAASGMKMSLSCGRRAFPYISLRGWRASA